MFLNVFVVLVFHKIELKVNDNIGFKYDINEKEIMKHATRTNLWC